jgi:hypothetical protein
MRREEWEAFRVHAYVPVPISIDATPIAAVSEQGSVAAAIAQRQSDYEVQVSVYREDPKDPLPINVDHYRVWERLPDHRDFPRMVNDATTSDDDNMRAFLDAHVFMVKEPAGKDHWLSKLPVTVEAMVQSKSSEQGAAQQKDAADEAG